MADAEVELDLTWLFGFLGTTIDGGASDVHPEIAGHRSDGKHAPTTFGPSTCRRTAATSPDPADVAEEVLRIHGFDHVPLPERMTGTLEIP